MRYEPLASRVILEPSLENNLTATGLIIPDAFHLNKALGFGTVIAVGPGRVNAEGKCIPCHVKVGDVVCYPRKAPAVIPLMHADGSEDLVLMLPESDIIAIVHDMPQPSRIVDRTGAPLSMVPTSRAMPDVAEKNRDELARAERAGFVEDPELYVDEPNGLTG